MHTSGIAWPLVWLDEHALAIEHVDGGIGDLAMDEQHDPFAFGGCERVLIGTSRQGAIYHLIKGHFQRKLESILPPEIPVMVLNPKPPTVGDEGAAEIAPT